MKNNNILFADFGFLTLTERLDSKDILFNVYKGVIKKVTIDQHVYGDEYGIGTADEVDSCGIVCTPEVWNKWEQQPLLCMQVELNRGFVWAERHDAYYRHNNDRILSIGGFDMNVMFDQLVEVMSTIQFENKDFQEDWTDVVYDYQKKVYGVEAVVTKNNRYQIANEFYDKEVHENVLMTNHPIRLCNNPLDVIPTIQFNA